MKKFIFIAMFFFSFMSITVFAQPVIYVVQSGDSMWKIAAKYQVGVSEILSANSSIQNPALIYPGQKISVPTLNDIKTQENEVIRLVNVQRSRIGLQPLTANWQLCRIARYKSQDFITKNYFSHTSPTYGSPFNMMESFGVRFVSAGENIANGQQTPAQVMIAWMNSPGHKSNILSPTYTQIGVGLAKSSTGKCYWTQMFIKPM